MAPETDSSPGPSRRVRDRLGRRLRDLRVSVTDRCNFRCSYCMPADREYDFFDREELLSFGEIERLARAFADLGAVKLRLTGGEPLLRPGLEELVARLAAVPGVDDLAMTTNGSLLARHADALADAGLDRVTVSLDSLDAETFGRMNGRGFGLDDVLEGIGAARAADLDPVKINMVVKRGVNDGEVVDVARRFKGTGVIVRFIEYMDVGTLNGWRLDDVVPSRELLERIRRELPLIPLGERYPGEVADRYRYLDGTGEIGFISSVSQPFCGDCSRARLSADGTLYTCLFAAEGTDLRSPLREGAGREELRDRIDGVWRRRGDRYSELRTSRTEEVRVRLYGRLKDGADGAVRSVTLDGESPTVGDLAARLREEGHLAGELDSLAFAVGDEVVGPGRRLHDGDEVGLLPPVSGG